MLIRGLYYRRRKPKSEGRSFRPYSYWWTGVICPSTICKWGTTFTVVNRSTIDFWLDWWCRDNTLKLTFPEIYNSFEAKGLKVSECATGDSWNWSRILGPDAGQTHRSNITLSDFLERVSIYFVPHSWDRMLSCWSSDELFSVRSTYLALSDGGTRDARATSI